MWGGNTLLWKKNGIKIKENLASFCGFSKSVTKNGAELLAVSYEKSIYGDEGAYLELFTGEGTYTKRLITCNSGEYSAAISLGDYFYIIKYTGISYQQEYTITAFYKFDENGNLIHEVYNARLVPTDDLEQFNLWYIRLDHFYVINDTFYIVFEVGSHESTPEKMANWFYITAYKNGSCISQKVVDTGMEYGYNPMYSPRKCSDQFLINDTNILSGGITYNTYHYCYPLVKVTENTFSVLDSLYYTYLGTDGENVYLTDTFGCNRGNRTKLFLFDGENYKRIINVDTIVGTCNFVAIARVEGILYAAVTYGDFDFPDHSYVLKIDEEEPEKSSVIYKLNTPKKTYSWAAIRQLTTKNGKLYVHKELHNYTDGDKSVLRIDEITFPEKKKGDTT